MFKIIVLVMLLAAPQLDPSLTPKKAAKPGLPKIDEKACQFEGCQFGTRRMFGLQFRLLEKFREHGTQLGCGPPDCPDNLVVLPGRMWRHDLLSGLPE